MENIANRRNVEKSNICELIRKILIAVNQIESIIPSTFELSFEDIVRDQTYITLPAYFRWPVFPTRKRALRPSKSFFNPYFSSKSEICKVVISISEARGIPDRITASSEHKLHEEGHIPDDEISTKTFVQVKFQRTCVRTNSIQGTSPMWRKTMDIPIEIEDCSSSRLRNLDECIDINLFDEIEFDESTQSYLAQVSVTLSDPSSGAPIGAMTIGLDAESLF